MVDAKSPSEATLVAEVMSLEGALQDSEDRNASLEALVLSLMGEMQQAEERRARERQLVLGRRRESRAVVPRAALESARNVLEEGSVALVAAHEHTLRLVEMRLAAMGEQLARCQSALPVGRASHEELQQPPSPTSSVSLARGLSSEEEDWAEPMLGGLCLDSLPLHVPTTDAGDQAVAAYGIHGRRPAISTATWTGSPGALSVAWWSELRDLSVVASSGPLACAACSERSGLSIASAASHSHEDPPSPTGGAEGESIYTLSLDASPHAADALAVRSQPLSQPKASHMPAVMASNRQRWVVRRQLAEERCVCCATERGPANIRAAPHGALCPLAPAACVRRSPRTGINDRDSPLALARPRRSPALAPAARPRSPPPLARTRPRCWPSLAPADARTLCRMPRRAGPWSRPRSHGRQWTIGSAPPISRLPAGASTVRCERCSSTAPL